MPKLRVMPTDAVIFDIPEKGVFYTFDGTPYARDDEVDNWPVVKEGYTKPENLFDWQMEPSLYGPAFVVAHVVYADNRENNAIHGTIADIRTQTHNDPNIVALSYRECFSNLKAARQWALAMMRDQV